MVGTTEDEDVNTHMKPSRQKRRRDTISFSPNSISVLAEHVKGKEDRCVAGLLEYPTTFLDHVSCHSTSPQSCLFWGTELDGRHR